MATANVPADFEISYADDVATGNATPPPPAPTVRQAIPLVDDASVSAEGAARAKSDEEQAKALGFSPAPPVFQIGTKVNAIGVANFRQSREEWAALPSLPELARTFEKRIAAEMRVDTLVNIPQCKLLNDGRMQSNGTHYMMSARAVDGLATYVTPGGASYLKQCPPQLRALNLNHWMERAHQIDRKETKRLGRDVSKPRQMTLRTRARKNGGTAAREVYAVTGPKYAAFNVDRVVTEAARGIGGDARGDLKYDGYRMTLDALFHSNIHPTNAVAGEFFKGTVRITAADDGSGAINVKLGLWRNLCRNLIIVDFDTVLVGSRRHVGQSQDIEADVRALMSQASDRINLMVGKWNESSTEDVLKRYDLQDVDEVFQGLVINGAVSTCGVGKDEMVKRLHSAWEREPGYSKTDILNAITRAAHENTWGTWTDSEELESQAGELLYAKVWDLDYGRTATEILS